MKLFLISQTENNNYDTYDSAVVAAPDVKTARHRDPSNGLPIITWCSDPKKVRVTYLGEAREGMKQGVVCASFNAG